MHILVAAGRARRRNDLELTAARRSHLHVLVDTGRRADDTLGVRELVAQRFRAAAADRRGSPLMSGGHVTSPSEGALLCGCAAALPAKASDIAMIETAVTWVATRMRPPRACGCPCRSTRQ